MLEGKKRKPHTTCEKLKENAQKDLHTDVVICWWDRQSTLAQNGSPDAMVVGVLGMWALIHWQVSITARW